MTKAPGFKASKPVEINWDTFRGGLNTLLRDQEIKDDELAQAYNLMLTGKGMPTKRYGYEDYFMAGTNAEVRGISGYYQSNGTIELVALTDDGYLVRKSNASYIAYTGASWASGYPASMAQLDDSLYICTEQREMARLSEETLTNFPTIAQPASVLMSQLSGVSGSTTKAYRISALTAVGETLATTSEIIANQPQDLTDGTIQVSWTAPSAASGVVVGYNIYGRDEGDERFVGSVDGDATIWLDDGTATPQEFTYPPTADTTGGVRAKYVIRYLDRLVWGGIDGDPSKVVISGHVPNHEKTDVSYGGNYIKIEPDAGDNITGLCVWRDRIIVFKEHSIWQVTLSTEQVGNFFVTIPSVELITKSHGCASHRTICSVENDVFFLSQKGVYILGYEPNIAIDVLRTNELSAKIRPDINAISVTNKKKASAVYHDYRYVLSFPGLGKSYCFDRERQAWMGPWSFDANQWEIFYDQNDNEQVLFAGDDDAYVYDWKEAHTSDNGSIIDTILRTKKTDFGDWSAFKNVSSLYFNFNKVAGTADVNIRLEKRDGVSRTAEDFTLASTNGNAGWGADLWANTLYADSEETGGAGEANDIVRWALVNESARNMQVEILTDATQDNYELLAIKSIARPIGRGYVPSTWRTALIPASLLFQPMVSGMAGTAPSNQVGLFEVQRIIVNMMNHNIFFSFAYLALIAIAFLYLFFKMPGKSTFISKTVFRIAMLIGGVSFANSLAGKFKFSSNRVVPTSSFGKGNGITSAGTILAPTSFKTRSFNFIRLFTNRTEFNNPSSAVSFFDSPAIAGGTAKRATFLRIITRLKRFITKHTNFNHRGIIPSNYDLVK